MSRSIAFAMIFAGSAAFAAGPPAPDGGGCGGSHVVARGETLYSIARRCHAGVEAIARASGLADARRIEIGDRLVIPGGDDEATDESGKDEPEAEVRPGLTYRFTLGDTIYSLARWAHVGVGAVIAANPGIDPHKIEIGDVIRLPDNAVAPEPARLRERGTGPGPAAIVARPQAPPPPPPPRPQAAPGPRPQAVPPAPPPAAGPTPPARPRPSVRIHEGHPRPAPAAPPRDKPDDDEGPAPEGM